MRLSVASMAKCALLLALFVTTTGNASLHDEYNSSEGAIQSKAQSDALKASREAAASVGMKIIAQEKHAGFECEYNTNGSSFGACEYQWIANYYQKMKDGRVCLLILGVEKSFQSRASLHAINGTATCVLNGKAVDGYRFIRYYKDNNVLNPKVNENSNFAKREAP